MSFTIHVSKKKLGQQEKKEKKERKYNFHFRIIEAGYPSSNQPGPAGRNTRLKS